MGNEFQNIFAQYSSNKTSKQNIPEANTNNDIIHSDPRNYLPGKKQSKSSPVEKIVEKIESDQKSDIALVSFAEKLRGALSTRQILEEAPTEDQSKLEENTVSKEEEDQTETSDQIMDVADILNDLNERLTKIEENIGGIKESADRIKVSKNKFNFVVKRDATGKISSIEASDE